MAYERSPHTASERRCTNCGTRVARDAETCFMCGQDLRIKPRPRQRISWIDALLVLAVIGVLGFWWQAGAQPQQREVAEPAEPVLPENIPVLSPTSTATITPVPTETPTPIPPKDILLTHTVRAGENLLAIAGFYGVTVEQIQQLNGLADELIRVGDLLKIPVTSGFDAGSEAQATDSDFTYTVREGDTVVSIAIAFGSTVNAILAANNLGANAIIRPGDVLVVPVQDVPTEVLDSSEDSALQSPSASDLSETLNANRIYLQPSLLGPPDQAIISREESVLLRWISVDVLEPNEWYVVQIIPFAGATRDFSPIWTKTNSHRLAAEHAPAVGASATYSWQVSVIQVSRDKILTATSPPSDQRTFTWQ